MASALSSVLVLALLMGVAMAITFDDIFDLGLAEVERGHDGDDLSGVMFDVEKRGPKRWKTCHHEAYTIPCICDRRLGTKDNPKYVVCYGDDYNTGFEQMHPAT